MYYICITSVNIGLGHSQVCVMMTDSSAASPLANRYPPVDSTAAATIVAEENESPSTSNHHIVREYCLDHLDGSNPPARAPRPI